jgi:hypothetical protein
MKNKAPIPLSLFLMIAVILATSAQAQTRSTGAIRQVTTPTTPAPRNPAPAYSPGTSGPEALSGCLVSTGDGMPTQYFCSGSAAGTSMSGKTNDVAASASKGFQSLCAPWLSGRIKVSPQVAQELSRSCFGEDVNLFKRTPSGSPNGNGPQGYANSSAPAVMPSNPLAPGAAVDSLANPTPQATDPETFRTSGSDAVSTSMDALINGSTAAAPSNAGRDSSPSDVQLSTADTVLEEIHTSAEQILEATDNLRNSGFWNATVNFLSTEVEQDLSSAIADIGGVFIDLGKGLLDPGTALGVKAIVDQANDPNKFPNAAERSQSCAIMPDTCPPSQANQPTQAAPQPKQP